ncbi:hypothetical protein [Microcoleus sp. CAWBG58]|nr:hypothetical protein [Microcoleus sp. CAWBG58]
MGIIKLFHGYAPYDFLVKKNVIQFITSALTNNCQLSTVNCQLSTVN